MKKLDNVINAAFLKQLLPEDITAVRDALVKAKHISITGNKVSYNLPDSGTNTSAQP